MSKEISMSINQFLEFERGNMSLKEIYKENEIESFLEKIKKNKEFYKMIVINLAVLNMNYMVVHADESVQAIKQIHEAENKIIPVILAIVGAICTICCIGEIGKSVMNKKGADIGQIVMKYLMAFAGACAVPWAFRLIADIFKLS